MSADAKTPLCKAKIATSSIYFVPHVRDYCPTSKPCSKFRREVRMQGSGTLTKNRVLTYSGKTVSLGDCKTAVGAAGTCLKPYISVAADPKYYEMGDIIRMPAMKGRKIKLADGKTMVHPGYFIVEDIGGAIKGANRFDFFTGAAGLTDKKNAFGTNGHEKAQLQDVSECSSYKAFTVTPQGTKRHKRQLAAIDSAVKKSKVIRNIASRPKKEKEKRYHDLASK